MRFSSLAILLALALLPAACGSSTGGGSDDPRCVALCTVKDATYGDVCSQASADTCLSLCGVEIAGVTATCATCLLEDAEFGGGDTAVGGECVSPSSACPGGSQCTDTGPNGATCTYCDNDATAQANCYAQLNPRTEVACETKFTNVTKCSAFCVAAQ
jgi:hypothetical protein